MSHVHRALIAFVLSAGVVGYAGRAYADAMSDRKTNTCTFFTKADAERALHGPVVSVPNELDPTICAWALVGDSRVGVTVSRAKPPLYPPATGTTYIKQIRHVTGVGRDAYTYYANAGAGGVYTADVLTAKGVTSVTLPEKAGDATTALAIARMMMDR